jgi:5'-3' exonuclease
MGIKSLNQLLKKYENLHEEIHISEYAFKKVAIDISNYMYKYKFTQGDNWMASFIQLIASLRRNEIHAVFIYDSPAPDEKRFEQAKRRESREKDKQKIYKLDMAMDEFHSTGKIDDCLKELGEKMNKNDGKRLLRPGLDMRAIEAYVDKLKQRCIDIKSEDFDLSKKLFDLLDVPYFMAPMEAETMCSDLCKRGVVDAVLSEDTDVLAYGTPHLLNKINTMQDTCIRVDFSKVLAELDMSYNQFLDMCIMCGTDYNPNIEGVGVVNAYKLIHLYGDIDSLEQHVQSTEKLTKVEHKCANNIHVLNHIRTRQLFTEYQETEIDIKFCGTPDWEGLSEFLFVHNCRYNLQTIKKCFDPPKIVFIDDDEK